MRTTKTALSLQKKVIYRFWLVFWLNFKSDTLPIALTRLSEQILTINLVWKIWQQMELK